MVDLLACLFQSWSTPADTGYNCNCQLAAIKAILVPEGKESFKDGLGETIDGALRWISIHYDSSGMFHLFSDLLKVVLNFAYIVFGAAKTSDTRLDPAPRQLDEVCF